MTSRIIIKSASYDKSGRLSFGWSRLKGTSFAGYIAEINSERNGAAFYVFDMSASTSMAPFQFIHNAGNYSLTISAVDKDWNKISATTSLTATIFNPT